jgi:uncharacterized lipoprotein YbaY/heat shock protein HslJ
MMLHTMLSLVALTLCLSTVPALGQEKAAIAEITGTVAYRQRSALPLDAEVLVRLEDVSRQDAPATVIDEVKINPRGKQVPIPFRLTYDPAQIEPSHRYHVRATISSGGRMVFTSTSAYPVITRGAPAKADIIVQPVTAPTGNITSSRLEGTFVYFADAGLFTECRTGLRYPVAQEEDNAALERAYLAARPAPGTPVAVTLEGRVELRPKMEGEGFQEMLIVERFDRVRPGKPCASAVPAATLEGTSWKLIELKGQPVTASPGSREAHLVLLPEGKLGGSGGCNSFFGSYVATPDSLRLTPAGSTMMACPEPLMKQEQDFTAALSAVTGYRIAADTLELLGGEQVLARFTVVHLK